MPRALPIPRNVLIHSAAHMYGEPTLDEWSNPVFPNTQMLECVRIEPSGKMVTGMRSEPPNTEIRLAAVLFYDAVNSMPHDVSFQYGDRIQFDRPYTVAAIEKLYDGEVLHHIEVGLV